VWRAEAIGEVTFRAVDGMLEIRSPLYVDRVERGGFRWLARTGGLGGLTELGLEGFEGWRVRFDLAEVRGAEVPAGDGRGRPTTGPKVPVEAWPAGEAARRAGLCGKGEAEYVGRISRAQAALREFGGQFAFEPDPHHYEAQGGSVLEAQVATDPVTYRTMVVVPVRLDGPTRDDGLGFVTVAYRKRWVPVDRRQWEDVGYCVKLGYEDGRRESLEAEWAETRQERKTQREALWSELCAACRGMDAGDWRALVEDEKLQAEWGQAAREHEARHGVPPVGYVAARKEEPRAKARGGCSSAGRRKGAATRRWRREQGWWYDEKGKRLSPEERARRKAEIEAQKGA